MITSFTRHLRWARTVAVAALALQAGAAGVPAPLWGQTVPPITDTRGQRDDPRRAELERRFQQRVEAVEVAFADAFMRAVSERGTADAGWEPAVVAAEAIERWTRDAFTFAAQVRRGR